MSLRNFYLPTLSGLSAIFLATGCSEPRPEVLPNILWITSEDNSPMAGCYGDEFATTPNMDKLAAEGFLYTHAYANAPVCAPARNTILTGVYANSGGNQHMRSFYPKSEKIIPYPTYLRQADYYCTNNSKEDYNLPQEQTRGIWDESGNSAHYRNRETGQPFFAVFNLNISHEGRLHTRTPREELRHDPDKVPLPPYHPDTPDMRHDWAQYYDRIEDMDSQIGELLKELEESGEAENTIVFYYGDHGGVLARSKRYVYETGTRVPFIIRIPEKYKYLYPVGKPGSEVNRLISFVDLVPTLLSIAEVPIPEYLQGSAFLGDQKTPDPEFAYMFRGRMDERYDMSRAVRDRQYRYIRNYMPYRPWGQYLDYLWRAPHVHSWEQAFLNGETNEVQSRFWLPKPIEELYDTQNDPWEINNLADNPEYANTLNRMRKACTEWSLRILDTGFIPEGELIERAGDQPAYDYFRSSQVPLEEIIESANLAITNDPSNLEKFNEYLRHNDSGIRYWGATGLLILEEKARPSIPALRAALNDSSPNVVVVVAEALHKLGEKESANQALIRVLEQGNEFSRTHAMNAIDLLDEKSTDIQKTVINIMAALTDASSQNYDIRAARGLLLKWNIDTR